MNKVSLILTAILTLSLVVVIAPNIFAANQGKILRNIAIWLSIFLALGLIYQQLGPGSKHPMFATPAAMLPDPRTHPQPPPPAENLAPATPPTAPGATPEDKSDDNHPDGEQGFSPPKE